MNGLALMIWEPSQKVARGRRIQRLVGLECASGHVANFLQQGLQAGPNEDFDALATS